jgi:hypothetical protein
MPDVAGTHAKSISVNRRAKRLLAMGKPPRSKNIGAGRNVYFGLRTGFDAVRKVATVALCPPSSGLPRSVAQPLGEALRRHALASLHPGFRHQIGLPLLSSTPTGCALLLENFADFKLFFADFAHLGSSHGDILLVMGIPKSLPPLILPWGQRTAS